jgi:hypothetical protein
MTRSGNSRRVYVTFWNGNITATYKDDGQGYMSISNPSHREAYKCEIFETSVSEYNRLIKWGVK